MTWSCLNPPYSNLKTVSLGFLCISVVASLAGCGEKGPQRYERWGTVTFQDKPVPAGIVYFDPDLHAGNDGPQGQAVITAGKYDTRLREQSGPGSGKYVVRIQANDGIAGPEAPIGKMLFINQVEIRVELPANDAELPIVIPPNTR